MWHVRSSGAEVPGYLWVTSVLQWLQLEPKLGARPTGSKPGGQRQNVLSFSNQATQRKTVNDRAENL